MKSIYAKSRDNARTPMQWDDSSQAGFTTALPWIAVNPNYREINASAERKDPDSVFSYYRKLIQLRKTLPVITCGDYELLLEDDPHFFAYLRKTDAQQLCVICNFFEDAGNLDISVFVPAGSELLLCNYNEISDENHFRPYEARMYLCNIA